jgi:lipopolysaccharide/colanic/teichoic acid biosynthesis glycosyltransferase
LFILAPFLIPVILILRFTGEREVFYIQQRVGRGDSEFGLLKFATMLKNSPNIGAGEITVSEDPRVLPFGKFLRKTKLNELPQLWNIIIGDMSVVGPRPMVPNTYANYPEVARQKLNTIRPGLTGIGSIIFRDEEMFLADRIQPMEFYREHIIPYKSDLEIWFVENNSLWLYIKAIFVTAWVVIFPGSTIADKAFRGLPAFPEGLKV